MPKVGRSLEAAAVLPARLRYTLGGYLYVVVAFKGPRHQFGHTWVGKRLPPQCVKRSAWVLTCVLACIRISETTGRDRQIRPCPLREAGCTAQ